MKVKETIDLNEVKRVHFIGIGGIGVSAVARMLILNGVRVSGSDISKSEVTDILKKAGARIYIGHKAENVLPENDLVIYSIAIADDNPELLRARDLGIKSITYPKSLSLISKSKKTIAVSGTHGKTTTTAMIAKMMIDAGLDPTVIVGSLIKDENGNQTNFIAGKSDYLVVEACEYRRSFLNINPWIVVVTNIDNDHLDYYKDRQDIELAFLDFAKKVPKDGFVGGNFSDALIQKLGGDINGKTIDWSQINFGALKLKIPGEHNINNAKAVMAVGRILGLKDEQIVKSLTGYNGVWRRFEYKGKTAKGVLIYDDYGHHPTEIKATLSGTRELYPKNKIIVVFQPHLYSRTKFLIEEFARAFTLSDEIIIVPIYSAREKPDPTISSEILVNKIKGVEKGKTVLYISRFSEVEKYIEKNAKKDDIVLILGAGDIYKIAGNLVE